MTYNSTPLDELDALIEEALTEEPFLKAPLSLHRGVDARVRIIAMREYEQRRFLVTMVSLALVFLGSLLFTGLLLCFTNFSLILSDGVSGGNGWLDYYTASWGRSFGSYQGGYSLLISFVLLFITIFLAGASQIHKLLFSE